MKCSVCGVIAFLLVTTSGLTTSSWSGGNQIIAQTGHMDYTKHGMKMETATAGNFEGVGEVIALVPEKSQIVVDHGEIPGFMAAMTMEYAVKPAKLLQGLKRGDRVHFIIDAKEKAIVKITRIKQPAHSAHEKDQSQSQPMGTMKMQGKGEHKPHDHQEHHKQMHVPTKMPPRSTLKPAEGASVKILSPQNGETVSGSYVNISFLLTTGKKGNHVHAYVDEELMGMFKPDEGSRNGQGAVIDIQPGHHMLELRVVTEDHKTELNATDTVRFMVVSRDERVITLKIAKRQITGAGSVIRVHQGEQVSLQWTTDERTTLHLHGYDIEKIAEPGEITVFSFKAHATGRFPIVSHSLAGKAHGKHGEESHLLYLEVHPR